MAVLLPSIPGTLERDSGEAGQAIPRQVPGLLQRPEDHPQRGARARRPGASKAALARSGGGTQDGLVRRHRRVRPGLVRPEPAGSRGRGQGQLRAAGGRVGGPLRAGGQVRRPGPLPRPVHLAPGRQLDADPATGQGVGDEPQGQDHADARLRRGRVDPGPGRHQGDVHSGRRTRQRLHGDRRLVREAVRGGLRSRGHRRPPDVGTRLRQRAPAHRAPGRGEVRAQTQSPRVSQSPCRS